MKTGGNDLVSKLSLSKIRNIFWSSILFATLFLAVSACSRSAWMKSDGHEVAPNEQLACAEEILEAEENQVLDHQELQPKIDACMQAKGYHRRPWWLLNDLHWDTRAMP